MDEETLPLPVMRQTTPAYPYKNIPIIEPTTPVYLPYNPYESTNLYAPPPPQKQYHKGVIVALVILSCLVVILGGMLIDVLHFDSNPSVENTPSPTSVHKPKQDYTATDIVNDFISNHLVVNSLLYGQTIYEWTQSTYSTRSVEQSSATFYGPSPCTGGCSVSSAMGVWVYRNVSDAKSAYDDVQQDIPYCRTNNTAYAAVSGAVCPSDVVLHNRCLLLGYDISDLYIPVIDAYCV